MVQKERTNCACQKKKSLKFLRKGAPRSMFHQQDPHRERCSVSRANTLYIHLYPSESPKKEPSHEKLGNHTVTVHGAPSGRNAYMKWDAAWFHRGNVFETAITTPGSCSLQHDEDYVNRANVAVRSEINSKLINTAHNVECFNVKPVSSYRNRQNSIKAGNHTEPLITLWAG